MQFTELNAELRTTKGGGTSRQLRRKGLLPAVLYGKGIESVALTVTAKDVDNILAAKLGKNTLIHINVKGGTDAKVMIKDFQGNVLTRRVIHVDFLTVREDQTITVLVPVRVEGKPAGLQQGGLLEVITRQLELTCKVGHIPEDIAVDVSALNIGQNIHLADIKLPIGVTRNEKYNPPIASVYEPAKEEVVEAPVATEAAAAGAVPATAQKEGEAKPGDALKAAAATPGATGKPGATAPAGKTGAAPAAGGKAAAAPTGKATAKK